MIAGWTGSKSSADSQAAGAAGAVGAVAVDDDGIYAQLLEQASDLHDELCRENSELRREVAELRQRQLQKMKRDADGSLTAKVRRLMPRAMSNIRNALRDLPAESSGEGLPSLLEEAVNRVFASMADLQESNAAMASGEETAALIAEKVALKEFCIHQQERLLELELAKEKLHANSGNWALRLTSAFQGIAEPAPRASPKNGRQQEVVVQPPLVHVGDECEVVGRRGAILRETEDLQSPLVATVAQGGHVRIVEVASSQSRRALVEVIDSPQVDPQDPPPAGGCALPGSFGWLSVSTKDGKALIRPKTKSQPLPVEPPVETATVSKEVSEPPDTKQEQMTEPEPLEPPEQPEPQSLESTEPRDQALEAEGVEPSKELADEKAQDEVTTDETNENATNENATNENATNENATNENETNENETNEVKASEAESPAEVVQASEVPLEPPENPEPSEPSAESKEPADVTQVVPATDHEGKDAKDVNDGKDAVTVSSEEWAQLRQERKQRERQVKAMQAQVESARKQVEQLDEVKAKLREHRSAALEARQRGQEFLEGLRMASEELRVIDRPEVVTAAEEETEEEGPLEAPDPEEQTQMEAGDAFVDEEAVEWRRLLSERETTARELAATLRQVEEMEKEVEDHRIELDIVQRRRERERSSLLMALRELGYWREGSPSGKREDEAVLDEGETSDGPSSRTAWASESSPSGHPSGQKGRDEDKERQYLQRISELEESVLKMQEQIDAVQARIALLNQQAVTRQQALRYASSLPAVGGLAEAITARVTSRPDVDGLTEMLGRLFVENFDLRRKLRGSQGEHDASQSESSSQVPVALDLSRFAMPEGADSDDESLVPSPLQAPVMERPATSLRLPSPEPKPSNAPSFPRPTSSPRSLLLDLDFKALPVAE